MVNPKLRSIQAGLILCFILSTYVIMIIPSLEFDGHYVPNGTTVIQSYYVMPNQTTIQIGNIDYDKRINLLDSNDWHITWLNEIGAIVLLKISKFLFNDYRIIPIIFSVALLVLVYFLSLKITSNKIISLLPVAIVASSKIFFWYSTSVSYPNFWVLFLMIAIYPLSTKLKYDRLSFLASIFCKGLSFVFLPVLLYYPVKLRQKARVFGYVLIGSIIVIITLSLNFVGSKIYLHYTNIDKIINWAVNLQADPVILITLVPVIWGLIYLHKKKITYSGFLLVSMLYSMFVPYLLVLFTDYADQQYRFLPFVIFYALACSLIASKLRISFSKSLSTVNMRDK